MLNEKNNGAKVVTEREVGYNEKKEFFTAEEKAQFEVFRNGKLDRETIGRWVRNDLTAIMSFVHGTLKDDTIFNALVDAYFFRYQKLHETKLENDKS